MQELMIPLAVALLTGAVSSVVTVAAIKVELRWLRSDHDKLEKRVRELERFQALHARSSEN